MSNTVELLNKEISQPDLWNTPERAKVVLQEKAKLTSLLKKFDDIISSYNDIVEFETLFSKNQESDKDFDLDILKEAESILEKANTLKTECLFSEKYDSNNCFIDLNSGAGGTESNDWCSMMLRMYIRFAEKLKLSCDIIGVVDGEETGIKSCSIKIEGLNSYAWFKNESGVHRLVRISPFNAAKKRMTSFASAWVYPEINDDNDVEINKQDLRIDTFRASGSGGQHVNTTESAIRITHLPTNIVVQCQNEKSQHRNKETAMKVLKARLYALKLQQKKQQTDQQNTEKGAISWGNQIRSYVMQPYQLVKDLRINYEEYDVKKVLDGNLNNFIFKKLSSDVKQNNE
ncbi:peptide chain release factor 2 [Candidatus Sneabacter namystus]|uniref:Peptide chain release factor 2 n=1 Tax=Candidatus Sneabacter namystus TaxID=2601646 RepID=A0A5C0UJU0_9RICK|nr:peptide chain release factor 2 [Candidatus Sneabacter namystus]